MKDVKVTYETERVKGTATDCNRLIRVWFTDWAEILPRGCVPVYGVKRKGQIVAPILWHSELLCQHPGSMADCIDAAERARQHWLKYGDPEMPVGDVYGFGATRHSGGSHVTSIDEETVARMGLTLGNETDATDA